MILLRPGAVREQMLVMLQVGENENTHCRNSQKSDLWLFHRVHVSSELNFENF